MTSVILFVRHTESEKNIGDVFASREGDEKLTQVGSRQALDLGVELTGVLGPLAANCFVATGPSKRLLDTAAAISAAITAPVLSIEGIESFVSPVTTGRPLGDVKSSNPEVGRQLELYRAGLASSYDGHSSFAREVKAFELRVRRSLQEIEKQPQDVGIVVATRSFLTAALIGIRRGERKYPRGFYGFVALDLGHVSTVRRGSRRWEVESVNLPVRDVRL